MTSGESREFAVASNIYLRSGRETTIVARDIFKPAIGFFVSVAVALGLPFLI